MPTNSDHQPLKKSRKGIGGPKSPEGKKRASMNALRHGLLAGAVVLHNEDPEEFEHFRRMYLETFQPVGFLELEICDELIVAKWRLRRSWATGTAAIDDETDRLRSHPDEKHKVVGVDEPTITRRAIRNLERESNELANANRYEMRYHRMYYRALNKLQELQDRRAAGKPVGNTVVSDPLPEPASNFPNELEEVPATAAAVVDQIIEAVKTRVSSPTRGYSKTAVASVDPAHPDLEFGYLRCVAAEKG